MVVIGTAESKKYNWSYILTWGLGDLRKKALLSGDGGT